MEDARWLERFARCTCRAPRKTWGSRYFCPVFIGIHFLDSVLSRWIIVDWWWLVSMDSSHFGHFGCAVCTRTWLPKYKSNLFALLRAENTETRDASGKAGGRRRSHFYSHIFEKTQRHIFIVDVVCCSYHREIFPKGFWQILATPPFWPGWPGELRHLHGLATAESCWQSLGYKMHLKSQSFLFHSSWTRKTSKRHQQARIERAVRILSANSGSLLCACVVSEAVSYAVQKLLNWCGSADPYPCVYRHHKKVDRRRDSKKGFRLFGLCSAI